MDLVNDEVNRSSESLLHKGHCERDWSVFCFRGRGYSNANTLAWYLQKFVAVIDEGFQSMLLVLERGAIDEARMILICTDDVISEVSDY